MFLCRLWSIVEHRDHFVRCLSVCPSVCVCLTSSQTFLVVAHSYVSQATHAFLGMLPVCYCLWVHIRWKYRRHLFLEGCLLVIPFSGILTVQDKDRIVQTRLLTDSPLSNQAYPGSSYYASVLGTLWSFYSKDTSKTRSLRVIIILWIYMYIINWNLHCSK